MNKSLTVILAAGLAIGLAACEKKPAPAANPPAAPTTGGSAAPAQPAAPAPAPAQAARPAATQETPEGTMQLFVDAMAKGDIPAATNFIDPGSMGYSQFKNLADTMANFDPNNDSERAQAVALIRVVFSSPYKKATFTKVAEQPPRSKVDLLLAGKTEPLSLDLSQVAGKWFIIAPEKGLMEADTSALPPPPAGTPAPPPVSPRAPEPAPATPGINPPPPEPAPAKP